MRRSKPQLRTLDARPDVLDFRDRMYVPTLCEVPTHVPLEEYLRWGGPVLDQGSEGACTGFGLATVAHYLLRRRRVVPDTEPVSPRMFYEIAKRYDEWAGETYEGSSARGAMKGWHKHGVCGEGVWPYEPGRPDRRFTPERAAEALRRPLGAYFRVNHTELVALHCAIAEVGALYATARVHEGWEHVGEDGVIPRKERMLGGHAFAIVAYDSRGFWIQNSWGKDWGLGGFGLLAYEDWLANAADVWVARIGVPVTLDVGKPLHVPLRTQVVRSEASDLAGLRPHVISLGHEGSFRATGNCGNTKEEIEMLFRETLPAVTRGWRKKRILLYAHGGLVSEASALERISRYRHVLLEHEVYPLAFVWHSDLWSTVSSMLQEAMARRRVEGFLDGAGNFLLERLDEALEALIRLSGGRAVWNRMKANALRATTSSRGGVRRVLDHLARLAADDPDVELHLLAHSAGSVFLAPLVSCLTAKGKVMTRYVKGRAGLGLEVATCTLWAPACTLDLFRATYLPAIRSGSIRRFAVFSLTDEAERSDCCLGLYGKSLLYLVSNALEELPSLPFGRGGTPLLGLTRSLSRDGDLRELLSGNGADWVLTPNTRHPGAYNASTASRHGDFDDDEPTLMATLARILGVASVGGSSRPAMEVRGGRSRVESSPGIERKLVVLRRLVTYHRGPEPACNARLSER